MALVRTTLTSAITASQLTFGVANTNQAGFPAPGAAPLGYQPMLVDDEMMFLVSCPQLNVVTVRTRGADGTDAVPHDLGSSVVTSAAPSDFPALQPGMLTLRAPTVSDIATYGQSGAIVIGNEPNSYAFIGPTATGALVLTLGAPSLALNGMALVLTSQSAFAHTVTTPGATGTTGLFFTGAAGAPFTVMTFPAQAGISATLVASNGSWNVLNASITPVTFS